MWKRNQKAYGWEKEESHLHHLPSLSVSLYCVDLINTNLFKREERGRKIVPPPLSLSFSLYISLWVSCPCKRETLKREAAEAELLRPLLTAQPSPPIPISTFTNI